VRGWRAAIQLKSVRTRLILWNTFSLVLLLVVLGLAIHFFVSAKMYANVDRELIDRTKPGPDGPPPPLDGRGPRGTSLESDSGFLEGFLPKERPRPRFSSRVGNPSTTRAIIFDKNGRSIMEDVSAGPVDRSAFEKAVRGVPTLVTAVVDGERYRYYYKRIPDPFQDFVILQAPYPLGEVEKAIAELDRGMLFLLPFVLVCSVLVGNAMTKSVLKPVRRMTEHAERIGAEDLSQRLPLSGQDEFAHLASTFNGLLERLEQAFKAQLELVERQRRFTADASHELRTPLTVIKANTSLCLQAPPDLQAYQEMIADIDRAVDSMSRLVNNLLILARADELRLGQNTIELALGEVVEEACQLCKRPNGATLVVEPSVRSTVVKGNQDELVRLFANLVDNAQRYTPADGTVTIGCSEKGGFIEAYVADTGSGIESEHVPHLLERFYRADASRTRSEGGSGLGLSICKSIVEAHGGTIRISSEVGKGTKVSFTLPKPDRAN